MALREEAHTHANVTTAPCGLAIATLTLPEYASGIQTGTAGRAGARVLAAFSMPFLHLLKHSFSDLSPT